MPKQILLVEDSVTMQKVVQIAFAREDYQITTATSTDEALARIKEMEGRPDVVVADAGLPGKSGYDLAAAIRAEAATKDVPVILLTSNFSPYDEARGQKSGVDAHLVKPVRFLYPLTKPVFERFYIGAGMLLYDLFSYTGGRPPGVPHHRHLTRRQVLRAMPSLKANAFTGGLTYYDAQVDDARYVANLARTASFYGAHVASRVRVEGFIKVGEREGVVGKLAWK